MKDVRAPDGLVYWGQRIVRPGGRVKFAGEWWQDDKLKEFIGFTVDVRAEEYWLSEISVTYPGWKIPIMIKRK